VLPTRETSSRDDDSRLIGKRELVRLIGRSYPTLWLWQQRGILPRARSLRGRPVWLLGDIRHWISNLPVQRLKGDGDAS
jgi:predicted DNA-binding transcriptional regulator AlpA